MESEEDPEDEQGAKIEKSNPTKVFKNKLNHQDLSTKGICSKIYVKTKELSLFSYNFDENNDYQSKMI